MKNNRSRLGLGLPTHQTIQRYIIAIIIVAVAAILRGSLLQSLKTNVPYITFFPAVILAALYGGVGPGLLATLLSAFLACYFWIEPRGHFILTNPADLLAMSVFLLTCFMINLVCEVMRRANRRASKAEDNFRYANEHQKEMALLRESEERFRTVFEAGSIAMVLTALNHCFFQVNSTFCKMLGYSEKELIGRKFTDITHPDDIAESLAGMKRLVLGEIPSFHTEKRYLCKDGKVIWGDVSTASVQDAQGRPLYFVTHIQDITERKHAEESLRESNERFRSYFKLPLIGIAITSLERGWIEINDRLCEILGYPREELTQMTWSEITHPDDLSADLEQFNQIQSGQHDGYTMEKRFIRKDGQAVHTDMSVRCVRKNDGNINYFVALVQDTTERKRAEEALKTSKALLLEMTTRIPGVVYQFYVRPNGEMGFYYISDSSERILGLNPHLEGYLNRIIEMAIPEHREGFIESIKKAVNEFSDWKYEWMTEKPSGEKIWFSGSSTPSRRGDEVIFNGIVRDITDLKHMEAALLQTNKQLRLFIEHAPVAIAMFDTRMRYLMVSRRWLTDYNLSGQDLIGRCHYELFPEIPDRWKEIHRRCLEGAVESAEEDLFLRADGSMQWLRWEIHPWFSSSDTVGGILIFTEDITNSKIDEEERLKFETQIQQQHKLDSIGILAGGIAHDFNNLLGGLFGYIELAREYAKESAFDKIIPVLANALNVMDRAKSLTGQLLTFSKGGAPAKNTKNISDLIRNVTTFALSGSPVMADFQISTDLWPSDIDENQFSQALDNIVRNARDAMRSGTVTIKAENISSETPLPKILEPGKYLLITIADQGPGISKEHLKHIFDPFFTTKEKGYGLGLSIAHSIISKHNGIISVDSEISKGTTFQIFLPAAQEPAEMPETKNPEPVTGKGRILVMDDDSAVLDVASIMLQHIGYTVICATHGEETIQLYKKALDAAQPINAVILDLTIKGGLGGLDTLQGLFKLDPDVNAIVSSGYAEDPVMANPQAYGFKKAVAKPYRAQELNEILLGVTSNGDAKK